jgi:hypothetical protein
LVFAVLGLIGDGPSGKKLLFSLNGVRVTESLLGLCD